MVKRGPRPAPVDVHLYGALRRYGEQQEVNAASVVTLEARPGETVGDALRRLGIQDGEVSNAFRNGRLATFADTLQPGDRLGVFPPSISLLYC